MKPQEHRSPESWRHEDAALRRALQLRNEALPQLPEGFAEKMQEQLDMQPAANADTSGSTRSRSLQPWLMRAAAVVIAALFISLPSLIHEHPKHEEVAQTPESPLDATHSESFLNPQTSENQEIAQTSGSPLIAQAPKHQSSNIRTPQSEAAAALTSESTSATLSEATAVQTSEVTADQTSEAITVQTSEATADQTSEAIAVQTSEATAATLSEDAPLAESTPIPVVGGLSADTPSLAASSPLNLHITLTFSPTATGTDLALNETYRYPSYENLAPTPSATYSDNTVTYDNKYYIPAGNGYTYAELSSTSSNDHSGSTRSAPLRRVETAQALNKSKHNLPFTASLMVNIPLTERLALETGLSYSLLRSTFDHGNVTFYQHTQQTLHYLGLPMHLHYSFICRNRWRLYGLAGLQVDFPISAKAEITQQAPYGSSSPTINHLSAPVQFAPVLGLGAQLNLSQHAALFVQPSLQWYIPTGSAIKTYRSEHPLTFAIPFGFRWTI